VNEETVEPIAVKTPAEDSSEKATLPMSVDD
jgi:hypothetical protein